MDASGCPECLPPEPERAWANRPRLAIVATLVDESHRILSVVRCRRCDQRFVTEFTEEIDWVDGEDPQSWFLAPISPEEAATLMTPGADLARIDAARFPARRSLTVVHPSHGPRVAKWIGEPAG
jgi:hypothetical protein